MPRTKVTKGAKRNRDAANREEKIRDYDNSLHEFMNAMEIKGQERIEEVDGLIKMLLNGTSSGLLHMRMGEFLELNLKKLEDFSPSPTLLGLSNATAASQSICNATTLQRSVKTSNPNDEGYLTEDSAGGLSSGGSSATLAAFTNNLPIVQSSKLRGRTPGPLTSARARRARRSRSASADIVKPIGALTEHASRNKLRTPIAARSKAYSADRNITQILKNAAATALDSPPTAFMRWPKPGEIVLSKCGSPVVAQVMPDTYANVNIPVKNGVLSLRPKKITDLKADIIQSIDPDIMSQIRTLNANLNVIVKLADQATQK